MTDQPQSLDMRFTATIHANYRQTLGRVLQSVDDLTDEQLAWQSGSTAPSIRFHVWHLARWADHLQAAIPAMTEELGRRLGPGHQVWDVDDLAVQWGLAQASLGFEATGMLLDEDTAMQLHLPNKERLLEYARRAFAAADRAVSAIDDTQFLLREREQFQDADRAKLGQTQTVGNAVLVHLLHNNRHLGMIESLRGLQGLRGTATS